MNASINPEGLQALYSYNAYASGLLFETLGKLAGDEFTRQSSPSHGSVQRLVLHMLECEAFFLAQCGGPSLEAEVIQLSTVPAIKEFSGRLAEAQQGFIGSLTEAEIQRTLRVQLQEEPLAFKVWELLTQAVMHSVHHRGELSIVLSGLGHPLPTLDIILQFIRQSGQRWD